MSVLFITLDNKVAKGMASSQITLLTNKKDGKLFVREDFIADEETNIIWLSNKAALEIAKWILDNVEELEE